MPNPRTSRLLDILSQHNVKASFFVIGVQVGGYSSVVDRAVREGHWMASHTWSHPYLSSLSSASIRSEMLQTEEAVRAASCVRPKLMRPPYGDYDGRVATVLHDIGYIPRAFAPPPPPAPLPSLIPSPHLPTFVLAVAQSSGTLTRTTGSRPAAS